MGEDYWLGFITKKQKEKFLSDLLSKNIVSEKAMEEEIILIFQKKEKQFEKVISNYPITVATDKHTMMQDYTSASGGILHVIITK